MLQATVVSLGIIIIEFFILYYDVFFFFFLLLKVDFVQDSPKTYLLADLKMLFESVFMVSRVPVWMMTTNYEMNKSVPSRQTIHNFVNKLRTGLLIDNKKT
jgi:hypothetical protein